MIERVVENWLSRVNERSYEIPFCQLLNSEGHQVVHLTRHGPYEEGKDIIAIDPEGTPCAYQLKSVKITLKVWAQEHDQIIRLVETPIIHPSIDPNQPRNVFLVTSDQIDEEVRIEIDHRNREWQQRGYPQLRTIVKGQLLGRFQALHTNFWPLQLTSEKDLLEFFLASGDDYLDKRKLADFLLSLLPMFESKARKSDCSRALANAAIMTTYALSPYEDKGNHVAIIEGWTIFAASLAALVEKQKLATKYWDTSLSLALQIIGETFDNLCEELQQRRHLSEGNTLVDTPFFRGRVTWIVGLLSAFALWKQSINPEWVTEDWLIEFIRSNSKYLHFWGEGATPQFLALVWFLRRITATTEPDHLLHDLVKAICRLNFGEDAPGLPNPYHGLAEVLSEQLGITEDLEPENYGGRSYVLECLVHLYVRRNWRQQMRFLWPQITHIDFAEFLPETTWQYCLWNCRDEGILTIKQPNQPQSWTQLRQEAITINLSYTPQVFQQKPELLLLFIIVYPHRLTKDVGKFLDECFSANAKAVGHK